MLPLIVCGLLIGAVLVFAASVLHAQERAADRPLRWIWAAAMALTIALTAIVPLRERLAEPRMLPLDGRALAAVPLRATELERPGFLQLASLATRDVINAAIAPVNAGVRWAGNRSPETQRIALFVWAGGSVSAALLLLVVYRRMRRVSRGWKTGHMLGNAVKVSDRAGPAVVGINPMEIVVPAWVLERSSEEQRLVLRHELQHVSARDPLLLLAACVMLALMPWNPFLWYALSRLRLAVELDCDRRVLHTGVAPLAYGRLLLDLSEHESSLSNALPALAYHTSHLERRLLAMTARPARFVIARRVSAGAVAAAALLAACESKLPTSAEIENMDAASAVAQASRLPGVDSTRTLYVIDGKSATGEQARTLTASRIASVEVVKGADRTAQVRLRTKVADSLTLPATTVRKTGFDGLFIIDDRPVSAETANSLSPDRISSIEVIKGASATRLYSDPRAANGVIKITMKK